MLIGTKPSGGQYDEFGSLSEAEESGTSIGIHKTTFKRDAWGQPIEVTDESESEARKTTHVFDELGIETSYADALGHVWISTTDLVSGEQVSVTDPNGIKLYEKTFDVFGRQLSQRTAEGGETHWEYDYPTSPDPHVRVVQREKSGAQTFLLRDEAGRISYKESKLAFGANAAENFRFDTLGRLVFHSRSHRVGESAIEDSFEYDGWDRVVGFTSSNGISDTVAYVGTTITRTDSKGRVWLTRRDVNKNTIEYVDATGRSSRFSYNALGRLAAVWRGEKLRTSLQYDALGRLVSTWDENSCLNHTSRNGFGETISVDACGSVTSLEYDALGRIKAIKAGEDIKTWGYDAGDFGVGKTSSISYGHGIKKAFSYNSFGRLDKENVQFGDKRYQVSFAYDDLGRIRTIYYPRALGAAEYRYTDVGTVGSILFGGISIYELKSEFEDNSPEGSVEGPFLRNVKKADGSGLVEEIALSGPAGEVIGREHYDYSLDRLLTGIHHKGFGDDSFQDFTYDSLDRLAAETRISPTASEARGWEFDNHGNPSSLAEGEAWTYGGLGAPPDALTKRTGNVADVDLVYDQLGRLQQLPGKTISYGPNGTISGVETTDAGCDVGVSYMFDEDNNILRRRRSASGKKSCESYSDLRFVDRLFEDRIVDGKRTAVGYVYLGDRPIAALVGRGSCGNAGNLCQTKLYHLETDRLASVIGVVNAAGGTIAAYCYSGWGDLRCGTVTDELKVFGNRAGVRIGYLGQQYDTDLQASFLGARFYATQLGRFLSPDPDLAFMGFGDGTNRYSYAGNDPVNHSDRLGRDFEDDGDYGGGDEDYGDDNEDYGDDDGYDENYDDNDGYDDEGGSGFASRKDELYYTDDSFVRMNWDFSIFEMNTVSVLGEGSVGSITQGGKDYSLVSVDYDIDAFEVPLSLSGFKVGDDHYGLGVGIGKDIGIGAFGNEYSVIGGHAEGFVLAGGGEYSAGLIVSETIGPETKGVGVEVTSRPEFGGATLRAFGELERSIKEAIGYFSVCPECR